jgi:hypothetical protein
MHGKFIKQEQPNRKAFTVILTMDNRKERKNVPCCSSIFVPFSRILENPVSVLWHSAAAPVVLGRLLPTRGDAICRDTAPSTFGNSRCRAAEAAPASNRPKAELLPPIGTRAGPRPRRLATLQARGAALNSWRPRCAVLFFF